MLNHHIHQTGTMIITAMTTATMLRTPHQTSIQTGQGIQDRIHKVSPRIHLVTSPTTQISPQGHTQVKEIGNYGHLQNIHNIHNNIMNTHITHVVANIHSTHNLDTSHQVSPINAMHHSMECGKLNSSIEL